ncbi:MAG: VCBS repeat-containing protein, partial [Bacteroidota bacterium]
MLTVFVTSVTAQAPAPYSVPWTWQFQGGNTAFSIGPGPAPAGLDVAILPGITGLNRNSAPAPVDLDGDGLMDFVSGSNVGKVYWYRNTGTPTAPNWVLTPHPTLDTINILPLPPRNEIRCTFADLDADGDQDMLIGSRYYYSGFKLDDLIYYENIGNATNGVFMQSPLPGTKNQQVAEFAGPHFVDLDGDLDLDLVCNGSDSVGYFENVGTPNTPMFQRRIGAANPFDAIFNSGMLTSVPDFEDFDGDGDFDMHVGLDNGFVAYYENQGNANTPIFTNLAVYAMPPGLDTVDLGQFCIAQYEDFTGDGVKDMIAGQFNPGYFHWYKAIVECQDTMVTVQDTGCDSYTVPSGNATYTMSGT